MARPGIDTSSTVDPREDIVVTARGRRSRTNPDVLKMPKGSFDNDDIKAEDDITVTAPKIRKMPKGSFKKGGSVSSASKRADGCATKGKTKGRFV